MSAASSATNCEKCGLPAVEFVNVDSGMRIALKGKKGSDEAVTHIPAQVCKVCHNELSNLVSRGAKLRFEQQAREKNKQMLWKSRVNLVKQARNKMQLKAYQEAAIAYEKYLRVLEMAYDQPKGALKPEIFGSTPKSKEITVIATAYWDLMRIYDTNPQYREKMFRASEKLAEFLPYSRIYPDIVKKAEIFLGSAKNHDIVKRFLKKVRKGGGKCFIATAAFGAPMSEEVLYLRSFRDGFLRQSKLGRQFTAWYYRVSPPLADLVRESVVLRAFTRAAIQFGVRILRLLLK